MALPVWRKQTVSLSWLDQLLLLVHPRQVVLEHSPWRGETSWQRVEVAPPTAGQADWRPALDAAVVLLGNAPRGAALRIVVADALVRYALLPWNETLLGRKDRQAMALALLRNSLGEKAGALEIAVDDPCFGQNGLAAGIERELADGLRRIAKGRHQRLGSIRPRLMAELAARRQHLGDGWFACVDDDWISLLGLAGGSPVRLRNHRAGPEELAGLLAAEAAAIAGRRLDIVGQARVSPPGATWDVSYHPFSQCGAVGA